jgi:hypothetical protein
VEIGNLILYADYPFIGELHVCLLLTNVIGMRGFSSCKSDLNDAPLFFGPFQKPDLYSKYKELRFATLVE